jgi:hypothetical protein
VTVALGGGVRAARGTWGREAIGEKEGRMIYRNAETWDLASWDEAAHRAGTRP